MGFRTVVVLSNDMAHEWQNDPELGNKIWHTAAIGRDASRFSDNNSLGSYGEVVEQVHGDRQSLIIADGYSGHVVTGANWHRDQTTHDRDLDLLKSMAEKLGYRVAKKQQKVSK
jgi:hypothetical protein